MNRTLCRPCAPSCLRRMERRWPDWPDWADCCGSTGSSAQPFLRRIDGDGDCCVGLPPGGKARSATTRSCSSSTAARGHAEQPAMEIREEAFGRTGDDDVFGLGIVEDVLQPREAGQRLISSVGGLLAARRIRRRRLPGAAAKFFAAGCLWPSDGAEAGSRFGDARAVEIARWVLDRSDAEQSVGADDHAGGRVGEIAAAAVVGVVGVVGVVAPAGATMRNRGRPGQNDERQQDQQPPNGSKSPRMNRFPVADFWHNNESKGTSDQSIAWPPGRCDAARRIIYRNVPADHVSVSAAACGNAC